MDRRISIIGAAGHVGLPLSITVADAGYDVTGIDIDAAKIERVSAGELPFIEHGAEPLLRETLASGRLRFSTSFESLAEADVLIVIIGTPVDSEHNPRLDGLVSFFTEHGDQLRAGQLIVLRSTVSPGTTAHVRKLIQERTELREGTDFHLVFAPERVQQTRGIIETRTLPQLIGAFTDDGFERGRAFFERFVEVGCVRLAPVEAEIGKLITNMARYISFAVANEFYVICNSFGVNAHKVIRAASQDYPRLTLPYPGANVGGPCLYKDGYFLLEKVSFPDLIRTSFIINESIPAYLLARALERTVIRRAAILGMTFKANCDDTRQSLSYKLKKKLRLANIEAIEVDPYLEGKTDLGRIRGVDAVFVMTPHKEFEDYSQVVDNISNPKCLIVDMWNLWHQNQDLSYDGMYFVGSSI